MEPHRLLSLFLGEGRELLQRTDTALQQLEQSPAARPPLDAAFRAVHSLKGMCATVGLHHSAAALHAAESVLADVRDVGAITPEQQRALIAVVDAVRDALDDAERGAPEPDRLRAATMHLAALRTSTEPAGVRAERPGGILAVQRATAVDGAQWRVDLRIADDAAIPSARALLIERRLARLATVLRVSPHADDRSDVRWDRTLTVWLGGGADADAIERAARAAGEVADCHVTREVSAPTSPDATATRTVRIPVQRLDDLLDLVGELVLARNRLQRTLATSTDQGTTQAMDETSRLIHQLRDAIQTSRLVPLSDVFDRFPRHVRETAQALGKEIEFIIEGRELEVDRSLLDEISDPLLHLVRNAIDHGLETPDVRRASGKPARGKLVLRAVRDGGMVAVTVADDGRGVDRAKVAAAADAQGVALATQLATDDVGLLQLLARPGLSTAGAVTALSGRGVGVDAVQSRVQAVGGRLELATAEGSGTAITIRLPLSVAMMRALLVRVADETYAIPLTTVRATHLWDSVNGRQRDAPSIDVVLAGERLPVVRLRSYLGLPPADDVSGHLVVLEGATGRMALLVDACMSQQEIVVKPLQRVRGAASMFSGGTILSDGVPSLILDVNSIN